MRIVFVLHWRQPVVSWAPGRSKESDCVNSGSLGRQALGVERPHKHKDLTSSFQVRGYRGSYLARSFYFCGCLGALRLCDNLTPKNMSTKRAERGAALVPAASPTRRGLYTKQQQSTYTPLLVAAFRLSI